MSPESMEYPHQPDPLLQAGAFIDPTPPTPPTNGNTTPAVDPTDGPQAVPRPDWLPPDWEIKERVRASGASAGTRDKYYLDPVTKRRFRSKKEVLYYLGTGTPMSHKKKAGESDADNAPQSNSEPAKGKKSEGPKRKKSQSNSEGPNVKKSETNTKTFIKNFNFDDVPGKVKWALMDVYEGTWRPLINGVDRVPESSKQEWSAAFTYLTLQNGSMAMY